MQTPEKEKERKDNRQRGKAAEHQRKKIMEKQTKCVVWKDKVCFKNCFYHLFKQISNGRVFVWDHYWLMHTI